MYAVFRCEIISSSHLFQNQNDCNVLTPDKDV